MRQIRFARRNTLAEHRRVPLNTIVLPPLTPSAPENAAQLVGKFMVNKSKSGSVSGEIVLPKSQDNNPRNDQLSKTPEQSRITQLEHNIKFLQEQHQLMLAGLHNEIESLKSRNRELQFQLVFAKGSIPISSPSPSSSSEDDTKHKPYFSPKAFNTTPLQVELLEKEMGELKLQLQEVESRNVYLSAIVDEQKKKLERYERDREKEREQRANGQADEAELLRKLEDAEVVIRRLRRENSDLRRDSQGGSQQHYHAQQQQQQQQQQRDSNGYQSPRNQGNRGGSGRHNRSGNGQHYNRGAWFPPLHSQNFWQGNRQNERGQENSSGNVLPNLQMTDTNSSMHQYNGRKNSNNNHYHGDGRKYRGGNKNGKPS